MADVNINAGNISSINLREEGSNPSGPGAGIRLLDKATGIYSIDSGSVVAGPLNAIFTPGGRLSMVSGTAVTTSDNIQPQGKGDTMIKLAITSLSDNAQREAMSQPEGNVVFVKPSGRGYKVFSIESSKLELAKAQGALEGALRVDFDS